MYIDENIFLACTFIASILAAVSGTGGGSLFIPLFSFMYPDAHISVPISKCAILGTAIGANIINMYTEIKSKNKDIHYRLATFLQIGTILGCNAGVVINMLVSSYIIVILMAILLNYTTYKSILYTLKQYRIKDELPIHNVSIAATNYNADESMTRVEKYYEITSLFIVWAINLVLLYFSSGPQSILCGTIKQQLLILFDIVFLISYSAYTHNRIKKKIIVKKASIVKYYFISFFSGMFASLVGIGGGMIKGPMLLSLGLNPIAAVSTSNYMILFTASTNVILFLIAKRLFIKSFILTLVASIGGIIGVCILRKKFNTASSQYKIAFFLTIIIILGILYLVGLITYSIISGNFFDTSSFDICTVQKPFISTY